MTEDDLEDFREKRKLLDGRISTFENAERDARQLSENSADCAREFNRQKTRASFVQDFYSDVPDEFVDNLKPGQYYSFSAPLTQFIGTTGSPAAIYPHMADAGRNTGIVLAALTVATSGTAPAVSDFKNLEATYPTQFPRAERLLATFREKDQLQQDIDYLRTTLPGIRTDVATEFSQFVRDFYSATDPASRYLHLIGARSLIFFKLIFGPQKRNRRDQISEFVCGTATEPITATPYIDVANDLYREMSDQDPAGFSVKLGTVNDVYIQGLFERVIHNLAALIKQRIVCFKP